MVVEIDVDRARRALDLRQRLAGEPDVLVRDGRDTRWMSGAGTDSPESSKCGTRRSLPDASDELVQGPELAVSRHVRTLHEQKVDLW